MRHLLLWLLLIPSFASAASPAAQYADHEGLSTALELIARSNARAELSVLATTAGGRTLPLLSLAPVDGDPTAPAVLVIGDPLGDTPAGAEAVLALTRGLVVDAYPGRAREMRWYLLPSLDPDGAARFFAESRTCDGANGRPEDDDRDGAVDEDGPDDLDGDGRIAEMLLPDPAGAWLIDEGLARKAEPARGERGLYRKLIEGDDDDGDGRYNEDGPGGAVPGRNFPHGFVHWTPRHGPWAASEIESRALLEFAFAHPEIALVLVFGPANTLASPPAADAANDPRRIMHKPPRGFARRAGLDTQALYGLEELVEIARGIIRPDMTEEDVLGLLDLGPAKAPPAADRVWWDAISADYAAALAAAGHDAPRVASAEPGPGNVQDWAYYQFGVPAFAVDVWTPPLPAAPLDTAAVDSTLAPATPDTTSTIPPDLRALADLGEAALDGSGVLPWREVTLADGTIARVGGEAPFARRTPPAGALDTLLPPVLDFVAALPERLPRLEGLDVEIESRGDALWVVIAHVRNGGALPYPTVQGRRTRRPRPVALTLEGAEVLEGRARQTVVQVPAMGAASVRWLVRGSPGDMINLRAEAPGFGAAAAGVPLRETGGRR